MMIFRAFFAENPPPNLHHRIWLLWASLKIDGLMTDPATPDKRSRNSATCNVPTAGSISPRSEIRMTDPHPNDKQAASDALHQVAMVVLRQSGIKAQDEGIQQGHHPGWSTRIAPIGPMAHTISAPTAAG